MPTIRRRTDSFKSETTVICCRDKNDYDATKPEKQDAAADHPKKSASISLDMDAKLPQKVPSEREKSLAVPVADFSRQYSRIAPEIHEAIERVCASQHFILGDEVAQFETEAAAYCGTSYAIGCASGTDALWLCLATVGIGPGDAVLTTPFSFFATVSSILRCGATPVLADIDPYTFNLDPAAAQEVLQSSQHSEMRAILPVHLFGQCADWDAFRALRREHDCLLIEDAAQAFGATWQGKPAGCLGGLGAFSFYPTKNLGAYGDAGMVTTDSLPLTEHLRILRAHGMRERYVHEEVGWNSRLDAMQAAILRVKLRYIEEWNQQRRAHAATYDELFQKSGLAETGPYPHRGVVLPRTDPRGTHVFHQYVIRTAKRDELRAFLTEHNIGSEIYYPTPLHLQPGLSFLGYQKGDFPESERASREVLALPMFPELTQEEQERVVSTIAEFLS